MSASKGVGDAVVGFAEAKKAVLGAENVITGQAQQPTTAVVSPVHQAMLQASLAEALRKLEEAEKEVGPGVLVAPPNAVAARLQSFLASGEKAVSQLNALPAGGREVTFGTNDYLGWLVSLRDHVFHSRFHPQVRPQSTDPEPLPEQARIAVLGDWGTGLYGAPISAQHIQDDPNPFWMLLHLGDVYYSGTLQEVKDRFLTLWPKRAESFSRALNSNHEMYSGGFGYFDETLPAFHQPSSYFAYSNERWLLLFLDTGYVDHDLDDEQAAWVHFVTGKASKCRVVLFSHHQLFSRLEDQGPKLLARLKILLESGQLAAWYWGHEHRCVLYDAHPTYRFLARCIGHGGIPYTRSPVAGFPIDTTVPLDPANAGGACWRRFDPRGIAPGGLVLDGPNRYVPGQANKYGPHGYATLVFDQDTLTERIHAPDGTQLYKNTIR